MAVDLIHRAQLTPKGDLERMRKNLWVGVALRCCTWSRRVASRDEFVISLHTVTVGYAIIA